MNKNNSKVLKETVVISDISEDLDIVFKSEEPKDLILMLENLKNKKIKIMGQKNSVGNIFLISKDGSDLSIDINISVAYRSVYNLFSYVENKATGIKNINITILHKGGSSYSNIKSFGVNYDKSYTKIVMKTIIPENSYNCELYQSIRFLQEGELSRSEGLPILDISNNDIVAAKHACAIGKIDESFLLYCTTKGIGENEAKKLIFNSYINDMFQKLPKKYNSFLKDITKG